MRTKTFALMMGTFITLMFVNIPSFAKEVAPLVQDEEMFGPGYLLLIIPVCVLFAMVLFGSMQSGNNKRVHKKYMRQFELQELRLQEEKEQGMSALERELQRSNERMKKYINVQHVPTLEKEYV
jgi:hypothetical protein